MGITSDHEPDSLICVHWFRIARGPHVIRDGFLPEATTDDVRKIWLMKDPRPQKLLTMDHRLVAVCSKATTARFGRSSNTAVIPSDIF